MCIWQQVNIGIWQKYRICGGMGGKYGKRITGDAGVYE